jgi:LPXTG-site transpeptidase (sortase) family protein
VSDPSRRRSRPTLDDPGQLSGSTRRLVVLGGIVAIVAVAAGLAFVLGGGLGSGAIGPTATPAASGEPTPGFSDLPLVTVPPGGSPAGTPDGTVPPGSGSPAPTATPSPGDGAGIRADRIRIARLGIDLAIIEGDGIDAPIGKAAHYPSTAWPGGGSNIYIYGHARDGMFITLWEVRVGDDVELDLVDGTTRTYTVTKVLPRVPWDAVEYLAPTPTEQLTLQTSTSYYPTAPRFVVIAVPRA